MDYTEQFIRLNCSLMSDYKMMKLNAEMKCMGIGLYIQMILFLRRQQEYKHDFNELDLLAEQWGATVEDLQHLIKDFNLFVITEDGYFRCLYLDEVMGYQNKLSEQRISHHLVQIQTSEIPVLCNEKQIEVLNKMLQIFHGSSPLIGQQIQFVKIMFVFLLFSQKQYRFKIQPQPHAFHIGIQLHHFVIRHQAAIQPDKLLCIIHFFCVLV